MRDFAKFAELIMNGGNYLGEQLLPKNFVEQATKKQICNLVENNYSLRKEGYGYQIWIHKEGFMLYGMGSQLAICFPDKQLMFVCNGDTVQSIQSAGTAFYSEVCQYGMNKGSGENISLSISSTNQMNYGYNFCNALDRAKYTLGWSDSYSTMPNWADIHDNIFQEIYQHMVDNSQYSMSCTISREIISVSDNMSMLVSVVG